MVKIIISEKGRDELNQLNFDIEKALCQIIDLIPKIDLIGLNHIYVTDLPEDIKKRSSDSKAAYYKKQNSNPAYIELDLQNIFGHITSSDAINRMLPIQTRGLAEILFHEVGHHIEYNRSHGIKKKEKETFANRYSENLLSFYLISNAAAINKCFDDLEKNAEREGMSIEVIRDMKAGWQQEYQRALKLAEGSDILNISKTI